VSELDRQAAYNQTRLEAVGKLEVRVDVINLKLAEIRR
jgi:hypothetical protein